MADKQGKKKVITIPVPAEIWKHDPDDHDYPAAQSYLSLICAKEIAAMSPTCSRRLPSSSIRPRTCCGPRTCRSWEPMTGQCNAICRKSRMGSCCHRC